MKRNPKFKFLNFTTVFISLLLVVLSLMSNHDDLKHFLKTFTFKSLPLEVTPALANTSKIENPTMMDQLLPEEKNTIEVFNKNVNSVVNVTAISNVRVMRNLWQAEEVEVPQGAGSGFIWNSEGYIVTNFHVVQEAQNFLISFHSDKKQYKAKKVGVSVRKDIAVLKLEEKPSALYPITVGISKTLQVGQKTLAIGNPFGLDHTVTTGIVSAIGRRIEGIGGVKIDEMIQTDASINPGNSGGPLLDARGRLIGMNTMILSKSGTSSGVGFAVPVDTINVIVPELIKFGKEIRPGLGVSLLPDHLKNRFGIEKGVIIASVGKGSAANKAGIEGISTDNYGRYFLGDIILKLQGEEVNTIDDIYSILDKHKVGDKITLEILREESVKKVVVTLMELRN